MRAILAIAVAAMLETTIARAGNLEASLWVADLQAAEEIVAAAVETGDADELQRQSYAIHSLTGRARADLSDEIRYECVVASSSLANFISALRNPSPARALVLARWDLKAFGEAMATCERAVGLKGTRRLRL